MSYIYGANVQGIQNFIFKTGKLKEIVGASQLVDNICTSEFEKFCLSINHTIIKENIIMAAAGNIRYTVDEETCRKIVLNYPKHVSNCAPGLRINQAVAEINDDFLTSKNLLEKRLLHLKSVIPVPIETGYMGLERARRMGGVAFDFDKKGKPRDEATSKKVAAQKADPTSLFKKFKGDFVKSRHIPYNIEHITKNRENAWLAIVHADGNGLGAVVKSLLKDIQKGKEKDILADFSKNLEKATIEAAQEAFKTVINDKMQENIKKNKEHYPIRPVILGGDDLTVIIRADLAFDFTKAYLKAFEVKTLTHLKRKLSACAGIAYIKQNYPFHYGVRLAEELTKEAKTFSKNINPTDIPSSLSFYKVQASFIDELTEMKARTHYAEKSKVDFDYGPYLINTDNGYAHVKELEDGIEVLNKHQNEPSKGISKLRNWLSELHKDKAKAEFMMTRIKFIYDSKKSRNLYKDLNLEKESSSKKTILKDLLELYTF